MLPCCVSKHIQKIRLARKLLKGFLPTYVLNFFILSPKSQILPYLESFPYLKSFLYLESFKDLNLLYFDHFHIDPSALWGKKKKDFFFSKKTLGMMVQRRKVECLVSGSKTGDPAESTSEKRWKESPLNIWNYNRIRVS